MEKYYFQWLNFPLTAFNFILFDFQPIAELFPFIVVVEFIVVFPFSIPSQLKLYFINVTFVSLSILLTNVPKEESSHRLHGQFEKLNNHWINWTCLKSSAFNAVERFSILCCMDDNFHGKSSIDFPHKMVLSRWRIEWALHQCATNEKSWYFRSQKSLKYITINIFSTIIFIA